jgi:hypothetical protein
MLQLDPDSIKVLFTAVKQEMKDLYGWLITYPTTHIKGI